jgi:hypothetical protein
MLASTKPELGVRYVLEGSARKAGGRVRITAQLIEAETGIHLWADRFDGSLEDVLDLQDQVAIRVAGSLSQYCGPLNSSEQWIGRGTTGQLTIFTFVRFEQLARGRRRIIGRRSIG